MRLIIAILSACAAGLASSVPAPALGQATSIACNLHWQRTESGNLQQRMARLRDFLAHCPHDARATAARTELDRLRNPARTPPVSREARSPPSTVSPRLREVFLDASGGGNARTLRQAWQMVASGGTIHVRPGVHPSGGSLVIDRSVRIQGIRSSDGSRPTIQIRDSILFTGQGVEVAISGIVLRSHQTALVAREYVIVTIADSQIHYTAATPDYYNALEISGNAHVTFSDGQIFEHGGIDVGYRGTLQLVNSDIRNEYIRSVISGASESSILVRNSTITGPNIFSCTICAEVTLINNRFHSRDRQRYALHLYGSGHVRVRDNVLFEATNDNWLSPGSTRTGDYSNNTDGDGRQLTVPPAPAGP